jgi:hypothetical protein
MPWKASSVMEERLRFVARLLDGETMTDLWAEPATAVRSLKTAQAVTTNEGRGLRSALASPPVPRRRVSLLLLSGAVSC